jgi:hypothetical protein
MEMSGQLHTPDAFPRYPSDKRLGGPQNWSGSWREEKNLSPARNCSPSLYRPSCPDPCNTLKSVVTQNFSRHAGTCTSIRIHTQKGNNGDLFLCLSHVRILTIVKKEIFLWGGSWGGMRLSPLGTSATILSVVTAPDGRWWWVWCSRWNENWQGKLSTRKKPAPVPLCPPQIPHYLTWARTRAAAVGIRLLTAWAMARHKKGNYSNAFKFLLESICFNLRNHSSLLIKYSISIECLRTKMIWHLQNEMHEIYIP